MYNNNKTVLIVSHSGDIHVDEMEKVLAAKGQNYFRLNIDCFPRDFDISCVARGFAQYPQYELCHLPSGVTVANTDIQSVWLRKKADFAFLSDDLAPQEKKFAEQEAEHLLNGFLYSVDSYFVSPPKSIRASQWKMEQLCRARKFGFNTPETLITNQPHKVLEFFQRHQKVITKPLSGPSLASDEVAPEDVVAPGMATTLLTEEMLRDVESVREFPCQFQQYVEKSFELRVTVIGNQVFSAKIDSQADPRTAIDFRDYSVEIDYSAWTLPGEIASACVEFVHSYGSQYGALDLIYTPDGQFVFLENNPVGQFWFVQQLVPELKMLEALADCLIQGGA